MNAIRFDNKVAVVTGGGNGLGKSHALCLASRGAKVVVNDLGGTGAGTGGSRAVAEAVVGAITAAGGEAVANRGAANDRLLGRFTPAYAFPGIVFSVRVDGGNARSLSERQELKSSNICLPKAGSTRRSNIISTVS